MNLKLKWTNNNTVPVTVEIYRGTSPIDRNNPGTPVVTLTNQETEWTDPDAVVGTLYYYLFVTISANDRNVSQNFPIRAVYRRGPGPSNIIYGDYDLGFYGTLSSLDFITSSQLINALNFKTSAGGVLSIYEPTPTWLKYIRKGKVYYVPNTSIVNTGISFQHLYNNGLVYGTNNNGPYTPSGSTPTNQQRIITIGPDQFIVRLMKSATEDPATLVTGSIVNEPTVQGEYGDFMYPQARVVPDTQRLVNCIEERNGGFGVLTTNGVWCQDSSAASTYISRGSAYASNATKQWVMYSAGRSSDLTGAWVPILELVEA